MKTFLLVLAAVVVVALPLRLKPDADYVGTDNLARDRIDAVVPGYKPWARPLWTPPAAEVESMLFALQAALGAGLLGYCFGRWSNRADAKP